jgi:AcrR family transcriptional regulator
MGKPKKPDGRHLRAKKTERKLTDAAQKEFAARGFEAASVRDIARSAGVNSALVSYHFGGKEGLFEEVIDGTMTDLGAKLAEAFASTPDVVEGTRRAIGVYLEHLRTSDEFPRLVARSILDGDDRILVLVRSYLRPMVDIVRLRVGRDAIPEQEITTLFAASLLPMLYAPVLCELWGWETDRTAFVERRHQHLVELTEMLLARFQSAHGAG